MDMAIWAPSLAVPRLPTTTTPDARPRKRADPGKLALRVRPIAAGPAGCFQAPLQDLARRVRIQHFFEQASAAPIGVKRGVETASKPA